MIINIENVLAPNEITQNRTDDSQEQDEEYKEVQISNIALTNTEETDDCQIIHTMETKDIKNSNKLRSKNLPHDSTILML